MMRVVGIIRKPVVFFAPLLWLLVLPAGPSVNAQRDERAVSPEQSFRSALSAQMTAAAQRAHVALAPGAIAYAGGDAGFIVNAAVQGAEKIAAPGSAGTDLLFVYIGSNSVAVPEGYYKVRLIGKQAQFVAANGGVAGTLSATIEQRPAGGTGAARTKVTISVGWGKDGFHIDIIIEFGGTAREVTVPIPVRAR
jgi:hypothetical protein